LEKGDREQGFLSTKKRPPGAKKSFERRGRVRAIDVIMV